MNKQDLPISEDLDFSYLLGLMRPLYNIDEFAFLPELFSLLGHKNLIELCRYCGGETITIPTLYQLNESIQALQYFYDLNIKHKITRDDIPITTLELVSKIEDVYNVRDSEV